MSPTVTQPSVDVISLEAKVVDMYRAVADDPHGPYHFEMGRDLAERLGYPSDLLDRIPAGALESFAGVGWFHDLADVRVGETVLDLGSGSGTDVFAAAVHTGTTGHVIGVDFTDAQLAKSAGLRDAHGFDQVELRSGRIEDVPAPDASLDVVVSNGVVNLAPDKPRVFTEAARILKPGGRLAIADIVTATHLPDGVTCNADLWAACIGGAAQEDDYLAAIQQAGFVVRVVRDNPYEFISEQARGATARWGVRSVSILATRS